MDISKVGVQLYTLRDLCKTPKDIAKTLSKVAEIGYKCVQVSGIGPIAPEELKKITDDLNLKIGASHISYDKLINQLPQVIEQHKIWECTQIAVPSTPQEMRNKDGYIKFANEMSEVGAKLKESNITLSYHNHAFEFEKFDGKTGLELIYENSDPKYFQAELDTYWVQFGGGDVDWWCKKLSGRLPIIHAKDYGIVDNQPTYMEVGEGNLNWKDILSACKEAGTEWIFVEQDICRRDPLESVKISLQHIKRMFEEYNL